MKKTLRHGKTTLKTLVSLGIRLYSDCTQCVSVVVAVMNCFNLKCMLTGYIMHTICMFHMAHSAQHPTTGPLANRRDLFFIFHVSC